MTYPRAPGAVGLEPAVELVPDVSPRRAVTSVNVRFDDKQVFDVWQAWLSLRRGRPLTQWEMFSVVLAHALENPGAEVPRDLFG